MKRYLFSLLMLLSIGAVRSQDWQLLSPLPSFSNYSSIHYADANTLYAVSFSGKIIKTTNGGTDWTELNSGTTTPLTSVYCADASHVYVSTLNGHVLKTSDGGSNWTPVFLGDSMNLTSLFFTDVNTGFVISNKGRLFKTTDGGDNWNEIIIGFTGNFSEIFFNVAGTGYIAAGDSSGVGCILISYDGGLNWVFNYEPSISRFTSVTFINSTTGFAGSDGARIFKTTDGGATWNLKFSNPLYNGISALCFSDALNGYAAEPSCGVFKTTDGGESWTEIEYFPFSINAMCFVDNDKGFISNSDHNIIQTNDGGVNWEPTGSGIVSFVRDIEFFGNTGYALTNDVSNLYKSTDGGYHWKGLFPDTANLNVYYADFISEDILFAYVHSQSSAMAALLKTLDGGSTWSELNLLNDYSVKDVHFTDVLHGFVFGTKNNHDCLYRTSDEGATWTAGTPLDSAFNITHFWFVDQNTCYVTASHKYQNYGYILKTEDAGDSWSIQYMHSSEILGELFFNDANTGYVVGQDGIALKTVDGGAQWDYMTVPASGNIQDVFFTDSNTGYILALESPWSTNMLKTTDAGINWSYVCTFEDEELACMDFVDANTAYLGGIAIYKSINAASVEDLVNSQMNIPVYPNPANDYVILALPESADIAEVSIINSLGDVVLKSKVHNAKSEVKIDVAKLPNGMYFVKMNNYSGKFVKQ
ncbi:MAG: YCF48-related protein [Bacteroidota bacterium]